MNTKKTFLLKSLKNTVVYSLLIVLFANIYEHYKIYEFRSYIQNNEYYSLDSIAGHHHNKNYHRTIDWSESELGKFEMTTNNLGFREDKPTPKIKPPETKRIIVTGDSHIDGVLSNKDSYPNVLERSLNQNVNGQEYEIINASNGFFSFKNYYGILNKFKYLNPDSYIITVYLGNDFIENLFYEGDNLSIFSSPNYVYYRLKKKMIKATTGLESSQYSNQAVFFNTFPSKTGQTIAIAEHYLSKIKTTCLEEGIELKIIILPSALEVDKGMKSLIKKNNWDKIVMNTNLKIKNRFIQILKKNQLYYYDLSPEFSVAQKNLYWNADSHLNVNGHRLAAKLIQQIILPNESNL